MKRQLPVLYVLQGKLAVPVSTMDDWIERFDHRTKHVCQTRVGGILISTVFLGLDHSFGSGLPQLFETMVFRGGQGDECERCGTWVEAEVQHAAVVAVVRAEIVEKVNT